MNTRPLAYLVALFSLLIGGAIAQHDYAVIVPAHTTRETAQAAMNGVIKLGIKAEPGSTVELIDGLSLRSVGTFAVPEGNEKRRKRQLAKDRGLATMASFLKRSVSKKGDGSAVLDVIRFPQAMTFVARRGKPMRVLVYADPCYRAPADAAFVYGDNLVPGDDFLRAAPSESVFGTAGAGEDLKGLTVYACTLGDAWGDDIYRKDVERFMGLHLMLKSSVLCAFEPNGAEIVRRALGGAVTPSRSGWALNPNDVGFVMRTVTGPRTTRSTVQVVAPPVPTEPPILRLVIVQDGSMSAEDGLRESKRLAVSLAEKGAVHPALVEIAIVVFRDEANTHEMERVALQTGTDGKPGPGVRKLLQFATGEVLEVSLARFKPGAETGSRTGEKKKVSRMTPLGASVDIVHGLERGIQLLGSPSGAVTNVLILCGDVAYQERSASWTANKRAGEGVLAKAADFIEAYPDTHVLSIFTPTGLLSANQKESEVFFRSVAAAAGAKGVFTNDASDAATWMDKILAEHAKGAQ